MSVITVTKIKIIGTTGENRQPHSGYADFSDGKSYFFMFLPENFGGGISFSGNRKRHGHWERFSFKSPAREQAVEKKLG